MISARRHWRAIAAFLMPLSLYCWTAAPGVTLVDSGEFVTVCATLGIGHPPGVPTYVMLGHLFSLLPLSADIARRLNLFSSVCAACASGLSFFLIRSLFRNMSEDVALAGSLAFGLSLSLWGWGTVTEVYALNIALVTLMLLLAARGDWIAGAFATGIALGVHHATVALIIPGAVIIAWNARRPRPRDVAFAAGAGLLGLSVYAYLPLRAAMHPLLNWGNPSTALALWHHVSGTDIRSSSIGDHRDLFGGVSIFLAHYLRQMAPAAIAIVLAGWVELWRKHRKMFVVTSVIVSLNVALVLITGLGGVDIPGYYLPTFLTMAWCFALGAEWLSRSMAGILCRRTACAAITAVVVSCLLVNFPLNDHREDHVAPLFVTNTLRDVPPGSLVLTADWNFYAPWLAEYVVGKRHAGIAVINTGLLGKPWYLDLIRRDYPDLYASAAHQARVSRFIEAMIIHNLGAGRQVFYTMKIDRRFLPEVPVAPHGLLWRYGPGFSAVDLDLRGLRGEVPDDDSVRLVRRNYAGMMAESATWLISPGSLTTIQAELEARKETAIAIGLVPEHTVARGLEKQLYVP